MKYDYYKYEGEIYRIAKEGARDEEATFASNNYEPPIVYDVDIYNSEADEWEGYDMYTEYGIENICEDWEPLSEKEAFVYAL